MNPTPISNLSIVISGVLDLLNQYFDNLKFVFDPSLSFEKTIAHACSQELKQGDIQDIDFPILSWNRTPIMQNELLQERGRRGATLSYTGDPSATLLAYFFGQFELRFMYLNNNIADLEAFEVNLVTVKLGQIHLRVNHGELNCEEGGFPYQLEWDYPTELTIEIDPNSYCALMFGCKVSGPVLSVIGDLPLLGSIHTTSYNALYSSTTTKLLK